MRYMMIAMIAIQPNHANTSSYDIESRRFHRNVLNHTHSHLPIKVLRHARFATTTDGRDVDPFVSHEPREQVANGCAYVRLQLENVMTVAGWRDNPIVSAYPAPTHRLDDPGRRMPFDFKAIVAGCLLASDMPDAERLPAVRVSWQVRCGRRH